MMTALVAPALCPRALATGASFGSAFSAVGSGTLAGLTAASGGAALGTAGAIGAGVIGSMVGSAVSQGFGVATGIQDQFSWKAVAIAGLSAGVSGGLSQVGFLKGASGFAGVAQNIARGAAANAITQGISVATKISSKFSFAGVAVGGVAGGVLGATNWGGSGGRFASSAVSALAGAATLSAIEGSSFGDNVMAVLPGVIGQTIGELIGSAISSASSPTARAGSERVQYAQQQVAFDRYGRPVKQASDYPTLSDVYVYGRRLANDGQGFLARLWSGIKGTVSSIFSGSAANGWQRDAIALQISRADRYVRNSAQREARESVLGAGATALGLPKTGAVLRGLDGGIAKAAVGTYDAASSLITGAPSFVARVSSGVYNLANDPGRALENMQRFGSGLAATARTAPSAASNYVSGIGTDVFSGDVGRIETGIANGTSLAINLAPVAGAARSVVGGLRVGAATAAETLPAVGGKLPNAGGVIRQFTQQGDQVYYRVFSGDSTVGSFLTAVPPRSSAFAREALALPPSNQAAFIQEVLVPDGTPLLRSRALPQPAWGRVRGGAEQFELQQHIPTNNFGPGRPLP